jgi:serine phosphatase RsbU (regulator of sigma subunit)
VTVFYAILDSSVQKLWYTSAGHCPVLFFDKSTKKCVHVKADGLFMGIFPDMILKETCHSYQPGNERIILYTDGLTEAKNPQDEMFDLKRLENAAHETLDLPLNAAVKHILDTQKEFCGKVQVYEDDVTLLVIDL